MHQGCAGADGVINAWTVSDGVLEGERREQHLRLESPFGRQEKQPVVRALSVSPADGDIIVGTSSCDILEVNEARQVCL
jgi:hypothetical protein